MNFSKRLVYEFSETKWNLYLSFVTDLALGLFLIYYAVTNYTLTVSGIALAMISGWFTFTLIEYIVHSVLFHVGKNLMVKGHAKHHAHPDGYDNLPFFGASILAGGVFLLVSLFMQEGLAILFTASILLGYVAYTVYHFLMHRVDFKNPYGKYMQQFHYIHHKRPKKNHGVTVPFWDILFGTYEPLKNHNLKKDLKLRPETTDIQGEDLSILNK